MSKKHDKTVFDAIEEAHFNTTASDLKLDPQPTPPATLPPPNPQLMDVDKLSLDLARERRKTALAEAKTALAQNDNAELAYKYVVLQIYMKYGLTSNDAINENGEIIKGGALPQQA